MYDTVRFWVKRGEVCPAGIRLLLPDMGRPRNENGRFFYGTFKGFTVTVSRFGVFLQGSLAKYYLGNNIETLRLDQVENAIESLSQDFGVDLRTASVTRVDFSTVILTDQPPARYYEFLGKSGRYRRYLYSSGLTLYYNLKKRRLIFYDKAAETQASQAEIPTEFAGQNLFRYELRFFGRLRQQLKLRHDVTGATLYDNGFYRLMVQRWHDEFTNISKINIMNTKLNEYIKEICEKAKINDNIEVQTITAGTRQRKIVPKWKLVSTHTARRSFASNLYKSGLQPQTIMKLTGHRTLKAFMTYIRLDDTEHFTLAQKHMEEIQKSTLSEIC